jgi:hypothetical protein
VGHAQSSLSIKAVTVIERVYHLIDEKVGVLRRHNRPPFARPLHPKLLDQQPCGYHPLPRAAAGVPKHAARGFGCQRLRRLPPATGEWV